MDRGQVCDQRLALDHAESLARSSPLFLEDGGDVRCEALGPREQGNETVGKVGIRHGSQLGCAIGLTLGQQSWLRLLNIEHHQVLAGTDASMAPGFKSAEELARTKAAEDYWARKNRSTKAA